MEVVVFQLEEWKNGFRKEHSSFFSKITFKYTIIDVKHELKKIQACFRIDKAIIASCRGLCYYY